jgi:membrane protein implicated in regulation of membrane protease activity
MSAFLVYLFCMSIGFAFVVLSAMMGHLFGGGAHGHVSGSGGHAEAGGDSSDSPGVSIFSPIIMAAFVTSFGGFGLVFSEIEITRRPLISAPLAIVAAFIVASVLVSVLRKVMRASDSSSESKVSSLPGCVATVVSGIPAGGVGEIAYVQAGTRYTAPAREEDGLAVGAGKSVTITRIVGQQCYVTTGPAKSVSIDPK